ncbi:hypothetical protein C8P68_103194 [Mucilaginibacter yixingensis]|uniref:Uncharacterized protein n=1 Tax=Mucilaginibacter yixingensis TaxID=1295612 RepID=A0A2T5JAZ1_9SPHI|nr:hypothetical protein C8P68_103194 [Mucilaginibacter yixingensis]
MPYFLNAETSQIIRKTTISTAIIPTAIPALKIPPITWQPLMVAMATSNKDMFNFLIVDKCFWVDI